MESSAEAAAVQKEEEAVVEGQEQVVVPPVEYSLEESIAMKKRGNEYFAQKQFRQALEEYSDALELSPLEETAHKSILYANRAACNWELQYFEQCVLDCTLACELNPKYIKAFMRRYRAQEKLDKLEEALEDCNAAIQLAMEKEESDAKTNAKLLKDLEADKKRLGDKVTEKNKLLQEEMMGKLKEMGNMILGKFGMSLDNFKAEKDPVTGSYSVNFKQ